MFLVRGEAIYSCRRAADDTFFAPQAKKIQNRSKNRVLKSTCFWRAAKLCIVVGAPQANFFLRRRRKFFKIAPKSQVFLRKNLRFFKNLLTAKGGYKGVSNQKAEPKFLLTCRGIQRLGGIQNR